MRVFLDTNVLLDTLVSRDNPEFARNAATILSLGEDIEYGFLDFHLLSYCVQ